jgi:hypothetical protein
MQLRDLTVLINPTQEQVEEREPLVAFSNYLCGRVYALVAIADEIIENLDQVVRHDGVDGHRFDRAEVLMWLWTLGAYEVVRTMCQARSCFSDRAWSDLNSLKQTLSAVRMPAAKMEKLGKKVPVTSDRSPCGWDIENRDLLIGDPERTPDVSARFIIKKFERVFSSFKRDDVIGRHETSYA